METDAMHNKDYKGLNIPQPVLCCIQRALTCTIFACDEKVTRANVENLVLLDHMLCPNGEIERPDLMLIMIYYWTDL